MTAACGRQRDDGRDEAQRRAHEVGSGTSRKPILLRAACAMRLGVARHPEAGRRSIEDRGHGKTMSVGWTSPDRLFEADAAGLDCRSDAVETSPSLPAIRPAAAAGGGLPGKVLVRRTGSGAHRRHDPNKPTTIMSTLWCQGMFASGSTWLYNVARAVAAELEPRLPVEGRFVFNTADTSGLGQHGIRQIVKAHQARDGVERIATSADAILVTLRDPRDAVVSLMQHQGFPFARALLNVKLAAEACLLLAALPQAVTLHYELGFIDDPGTIDGIAGHMGGSVSVERRERIFAGTRRPAIEAYIAQLETQPSTIVDRSGDVYDLATHWHKHHAGRSGKSGRWRRLLYPAQLQGIEQALGGWMHTFGYRLSFEQISDYGTG